MTENLSQHHHHHHHHHDHHHHRHEGKNEAIDILCKVLIIGDSNVGKTNLLNRFTKNQFSLEIKPTIGVEFSSKVVTMDSKIIKAHIWDLAGDERFRTITEAYYRGAIAALLVYDITQRKTFQNLPYWTVKLSKLTGGNIAVILIGNKCDLESQREVSLKEGKEYAEIHHWGFLETSALESTNIDQAFNSAISFVLRENLSDGTHPSYGPPSFFAHTEKLEKSKKDTSSTTKPHAVSNIFSSPSNFSKESIVEKPGTVKGINISGSDSQQLKGDDTDFSIKFAKDVAYRHPTVYKNVSSILVKNIGVLSDFKAMEEKYSDHLVHISILQDGESKPPFPGKQMTMKEFFSLEFSEETLMGSRYLQQREIDRDLPELIKEAGISLFGPHALSDLIPIDLCHSPTFYIGNKGIRTSLHYDRSCDTRSVHYQKNDTGKHNLFLQISGIRRFTLFPMHLSEDLLPDEGSRWPHVSKSTTFLHTVLDHVPEEEGLQKQLEYLSKSPYPSLAKAWPKRIEIVLKGGEALLIPARWWHYTEILEGGSALNWWFLVDDSLQSKILTKLETSNPADKKCIIC